MYMKNEFDYLGFLSNFRETIVKICVRYFINVL